MTKYVDVSLDSGFGYTLALSSFGSTMIQTVAGEPTNLLLNELNLEENLNGLISKVNGRELFVGDLAIKQSPVRYFSLKENKPSDDISKFIAVTAIGMVVPETTERISLVTALPVNHYFTYIKQEAETAYLGDYDVSINGVKRKFTIERCKVTVQGMEAIFDLILNDDGSLIDNLKWIGMPFAVVDIGFYTTNLIVVDGFQPVRRLCKSIPIGVSSAWKLLVDFLYKEIGVELSVYEVDSIAKSGVVHHGGNSWDIKPLVAKATSAVATEINGQIETIWSKRHFVKIFGVGGGMIQMGTKILPGEIHFVKEPQWANVKGGLKLARRETACQEKKIG